MNPAAPTTSAVSSLGMAGVPGRKNRIRNVPIDPQRRVIPKNGELPRTVVVRRLLIVENGAIAEHQMPIPEFWRDEDLQPILLGQHEGSPAAVFRRVRVPVHHSELEFAQ